jgi:hypothetical protein
MEIASSLIINRQRADIIRRLVPDIEENKMRFVSILALALGVALPAPIVALASDGMTWTSQHKIHMRHAVHGSFNPAATALAPAAVPTAPAPKSDGFDGLSRDQDQCNMGCIDN